METGSARRKRKLKELVELHGLAELAEQAEVNPQFLQQVLDGTPHYRTKKARNLGDKAARKIEAAWKLGEGWFDTPDLPERPAISREAAELARLYDLFPEGEIKRSWFAQAIWFLESRAAQEARAPEPDLFESPTRELEETR